MNEVAFKGNNFFTRPTYHKSKQDCEVGIFYSNDAHGTYKKLPNLISAVDEFRSTVKDIIPNFVVSTGDNFIGRDKDKKNLWIDILNNYLKPDLCTLGNHEFDDGSDNLQKVIDKANFKYLAANIDVAKNKLMSLEIEKGKLASSTIITRNGEKFGFIGVVPVDTPKYVTPEKFNGVSVFDFGKTAKAIEKEVNSLQSQGINKIVLLSHLGYLSDLIVAGGLEHFDTPENIKFLSQLDSLKGIESLKGIRGIDIIIGGHTHDLLPGVVSQKKASKQNQSLADMLGLQKHNKSKINLIIPNNNEPVLITQAGGENEYIGYVNVVFDENGVIKQDSIVNRIRKVKNWSVKKQIKQVIDQYFGKEFKVVKMKQPVKQVARDQESPITLLVADSILEEANRRLPEDKKAQFVLIHSALVRSGMEGIVTSRDIEKEIIPFTRKFCVLRLTEKDIVKALNRSGHLVNKAGQKPVLLHPSGLKYSLSDSPVIKETGCEQYLKDAFLVDKDGNIIEKLNTANPSKEKTFNVVIEEYFMHGRIEEGKLVGQEGFNSFALEDWPNKEHPCKVVAQLDFNASEALISFLQRNYQNTYLELTPQERVSIVKSNQPDQKPIFFGSLSHSPESGKLADAGF